MQSAKDSFFMALRERLVALDPQRTVTANGTTRPAIIVAENEVVIPVEPQPDAFYVEWGGVQPVEGKGLSWPLLAMECTVSYHTVGKVESGVDRGRTLARLDNELLSVLQPSRTRKRDYAQTPSVDLGTNVVWTAPTFGEVTGGDGGRAAAQPRLERRVSLRILFFPEVHP